MLPEIGASELLVIAVVALIVVGPKDLPMLLRKLGQFMAKLRGMAADFRSSFDEMARQSELDDLRKEVEAMRKGQYADIAARAADVQIEQTFDEIHSGLSGGPPMLSSYSEPGVAPVEPAPAKAPRARKPAAAKPKAGAKKPVAAKAPAAKRVAKKAAPARRAKGSKA